MMRYFSTPSVFAGGNTVDYKIMLPVLFLGHPRWKRIHFLMNTLPKQPVVSGYLSGIVYSVNGLGLY